MSADIKIRLEQPEDVQGIRAVNLAAFPNEKESRLVDHLRANGNATVSLVVQECAQEGYNASPESQNMYRNLRGYSLERGLLQNTPNTHAPCTTWNPVAHHQPN